MVENSLTEAKQNVGPIASELKKRNIGGQEWKVLKETVYPDAADASILMAVDYCKVRHLDILKKPVHIVPIWNEKKGKMVDSVWQGISELRTTAMRTKEYAGIDETIFGEEATQDVHGVTVTFPKYAQVTVYRNIAGQRVAFVGDKVYWLENYAKKKGGAPNAMWQQRPYGQLGKCAEAAALRKAFPEEIGNDYTAEEMEGKVISDITVIDAEPIKDVSNAIPEVLKEELNKPEAPDPLDNFDD
ncbi:MAG: phage recombination protein Bet [Candidatus Melainabacteria bacterium]|nr:MAG: phage recombination protein Bet [Candidatus Melainabacteria bacterium]